MLSFRSVVRVSSGALFGTLLLAAVNPAIASNAKILPGTMCLEQGNTTFWRPDQGNIATNTSSSQITVVCPVVRDNTLNSTGLYGLKVYCRNSSTGAAASCLPQALDEYGKDVPASPVLMPKACSSSGTIDFGTTLNRSVPAGSFIVKCTMPAGTSIISVRQDEY
jgi:hypothetical protein